MNHFEEEHMQQNIDKNKTEMHRYDAFISYSHKADSELANLLQVRLERWARPWFASRTAKLFRDQVSLTATPHLWTTIAKSLDSSKYLILLASTDSVASEWVPKEIAYWLTEGKCDDPEELKREQVVQDRADRMMIVLTEGEIVWSYANADFDWGATSALHPVLRKLSWQPLWTDLRWARGVTAKQIEADERFTEPVLKLLSPIRGKTPQELLDANDKEQKRAVSLFRRLSIGLAVGFIVASISGYVAYQQTLEALGLLHESEIQRLSAEAGATRTQYPIRSVLLAAEAVKRNRFNGKPPLLVAARHAKGEVFNSSAFSSSSGQVLLGGTNGTVELIDLEEGNRLTTIQVADKLDVTCCAFSPQGKYFAYAHDGYVDIRHNSPPYKTFRRIYSEGGAEAMVFCPGNDRIIVGGTVVRIFSLQRENERGEELEMGARGRNDSIRCMAIDSKGKAL